MGRGRNLEYISEDNEVLLLDNCVLGGSLADSRAESSKKKVRRFLRQAESYSFWINSIKKGKDSGTAHITTDIFGELSIGPSDRRNMAKLLHYRNLDSLDFLYRNNERLKGILLDNSRVFRMSQLDFDMYYNLGQEFEEMYKSIDAYLKQIDKAPLSEQDRNLVTAAATVSKLKDGRVSLVSNDKGVSLAWKGIIDFYPGFRDKLGFYRRDDMNSFIYGKFR